MKRKMKEYIVTIISRKQKIVTHRPRIKASCNKHYKFEQHMMKEIIDV